MTSALRLGLRSLACLWVFGDSFTTAVAVAYRFPWGSPALLGVAAALVSLLVVVRRRGEVPLSRQQRQQALAQQWVDLATYATTTGRLLVRTKQIGNHPTGATAWIEPISVDGCVLNDSWFHRLAVAPNHWYAVRGEVSYRQGFRSRIYLVVWDAPAGAPESARRAWLRRQPEPATSGDGLAVLARHEEPVEHAA